MPQTVQQLKAKEAALKKAMAANPSNKATQRLGASSLATTQSKLSASQNKVSTGINLKNTAAETKTSSQIASQQTLRGNYLNSRATSTPINTVNGRASSNQLVRDSKGNSYASQQSGFSGSGRLVTGQDGRQYVLDPSTGTKFSVTSGQGKALLGATNMSSADYTRSLRAAQAAARGKDTVTGEQLSYNDIGRGMIQNEYDATGQTAKDLGLGDTYSSLDEYTKDQAKAQAEQKALKETQLANQETIAGMDLSLAGRQAKSQFSAARGQLVNGREGVTSMTNLSTIDRLRTSRDEQMTRIGMAYDEQMLVIEQTRRDLARAEKAGNTALAEQYRGQIAAAEMQAKAIDTEYMTALTQQLGAESDYARTQSAIKQSGIQTFQGLVESGVAMDYNTVAGYAAQLDLPTDLLMGYYQGAEVIRNDKTLDQEAKAVQIAQLNQDLQDQMDGLTTEAAKKIDYLNKQTAQWQALGMSESEIAEARSNMRTMLGIEDQSDPAYLADLAYKEAQAKYIESNTAVNYQDLLIKKFDYAKSMGYEGGAYIPNSTRGGKYKVQTVTSEDGSIGVQVTNSEGEILGEGDYGGQCGAFVNDLFGANVFGDDYTDKLAQVDFSLTMPAAGMAIVLPQKGAYAKSGHVVYITSVDSINEKINYIDSNGNGDETIGYHSMTFEELGHLIETKTGGLVVNDNATLEGGTMGAGESNPYSYQNFYREALSQGQSQESAQKYAEKQFELASTFKNEFSQKQYMIYSTTNRANKAYGDVIENMTDEELVNYAEKNNYISQRLIDYNGDEKLTSAIINELTDDQQTRDLIRAQAEWVGAKLRGESGAAITVGEYITETSKYFPTRGDDADAIRALFEKRKLYTSDLEKSLDLHGRSLAWEDAQAELAASDAEQQVDPDVEEYNSFSDLQDDDYWAGREALGLPAPWIERAMDLVQSKANQ